MQAAWRRQARWLLLLKPVEYIYRAVMAARDRAYRHGFLRSVSLDVPVIVIGNLRLGGTGKTPLVIAVVDALQRQGYQVGVVSRGYGGVSPAYPLLVDAKTDVAWCGDEARMIVLRTGANCAVAPCRVSAARQLTSVCDVIVSDDGLQHLHMDRDIEIALVSDEERAGRVACLPCGPLRESAARLTRVHRVIAPQDLARPPWYDLQQQVWVNLRSGEQRSVQAPGFGRRLAALAAIAEPERYFDTLRTLELEFDAYPLADHAEVQSTLALCESYDEILMTEKDAVKCSAQQGDKLWYLRQTLLVPQEFEHWLVASLRNAKHT